MNARSERINWRQFKALTATSLKVQLRGKSGKTQFSRLLGIFFSYTFASTYLAFSLGESNFEPAYVLIATTITLYIAGFTFISSYANVLLDKDEKSILDQFPINTRTFAIARTTNLFAYMFIVCIPFILPLAVYYGFWIESPLGGFSMFAALFAASIWMTLVFLFLFVTFITKSRKMLSMLPMAQVVMIFGFLIMYQAVPRYFINDVEWNALFNSPYAAMTPPVWFSAFHWEITGPERFSHQFGLAAIGILTLLGLLIFTRTDWVHTMVETSARKRSAVRQNPLVRIAAFIGSALGKTSVQFRSGYYLFTQMLAQERTLLLQIIPIALMPLAIALYGTYTGELTSPFPHKLTAWYSKMHIPVFIFFLFVSRHIENIVAYSPKKDAQWILQAAPVGFLRAYTDGVRLGVVVLLLAPIAVLLLGIFRLSMPLTDAVLQAAYLLIAALWQSRIMQIIKPRIPFYEDIEHLASAQRVLQLFYILPFFAVFIALHYVFSGSPSTFMIMLAVMYASVLALRPLSSMRFASVAQKQLYQNT